MEFNDFKESLIQEHPPKGVSVYLQALWFDGKGNWQKAHSLIDELSGTDAAAVHAYLHRKEGDLFNAGYWYNRAQKSKSTVPLADEWEELVREFL
jgi:hypothetical protein